MVSTSSCNICRSSQPALPNGPYLHEGKVTQQALQQHCHADEFFFDLERLKERRGAEAAKEPRIKPSLKKAAFAWKVMLWSTGQLFWENKRCSWKDLPGFSVVLGTGTPLVQLWPKKRKLTIKLSSRPLSHSSCHKIDPGDAERSDPCWVHVKQTQRKTTGKSNKKYKTNHNSVLACNGLHASTCCIMWSVSTSGHSHSNHSMIDIHRYTGNQEGTCFIRDMWHLKKSQLVRSFPRRLCIKAEI